MRPRARPPRKISSNPTLPVGTLEEGVESKALNFFMVQFLNSKG